MIEKIFNFAERLAPVALVGAGGIGKTSIALAVLHDDRIKRQFGDQRRFIRCDKFPPSLPNFLRRLSKIVGSDIENPEDLAPLRPLLSSKDMFIILDNAESILDPHVANAEEIYEVVEELSQLSNICLCVTSRISTIPPEFELLDIPTLSKEAACDTFYRIYKRGQPSDSIDSLLEQLDFHALSITLLATVAHHNRWDAGRLVREWCERRTDVLQTDHNKSLAATIELSLSSLIFQELGPDARDLLGVIAFFPQGVDENKIDWLFPTISGRKNMFDKFCVLSLAYRNEGFVTMLAPVRDYLSPRDPASTPLLCSTKERYFSKLSAGVGPGRPGLEDGRWIVSEDVNVEHLLDVFITTDATSSCVWDACGNFTKHLVWHKPRSIVPGRKIEALADDHPCKVECLLQLSDLFLKLGNRPECKRILTETLKISQERGDDLPLAETLMKLSRVHSFMGSHKEAIRQGKEASELYERLGDTVEQARCLVNLVRSFNGDNQLDAAEEAGSRAITLLQGKNEQYLVCRCHRLLGDIYRSNGDTDKAIHHLEAALGIASSLNMLNMLIWIRYSLARLFSDQDKFDDAHAHIEHAKLHAVNDYDTYSLGCMMEAQAWFWHKQQIFTKAKSEALRALDAYEKLGAASEVGDVKAFLQQIENDARDRRRKRCSYP